MMANLKKGFISSNTTSSITYALLCRAFGLHNFESPRTFLLYNKGTHKTNACAFNQFMCLAEL